GDASVTRIELLVGLVDELSAAAPAVIVLEDLQWADDASLIVWHQLAASIGQLRLLLSGTCRPTPRRPEVQELRGAGIRHGCALGGARSAATDLAVVLRGPASELAADVQEVVAAGIVTEHPNDPDLAFRHLLIQQALYESMPAALRTALHAEAARELAAAGADVLSVAQQLSAANKPGEAWTRTWLVESGPALAIRAPQVG